MSLSDFSSQKAIDCLCTAKTLQLPCVRHDNWEESNALACPEHSLQDPFYHRQKRPKKTRMLDADAWLDSSMYEFWQSLGRGYTRVQDFFARFQVRGIKRFFVEIFSDALSFTAIGAVLMTALALPAFNATASGRYNQAEDISVIFLDRYGNEIGRRGIRSDDSIALDKLPDFLVKATLATEDRRFYEHFGIDAVGTLRRSEERRVGRARRTRAPGVRDEKR